jgi:hypothetical protein
MPTGPAALDPSALAALAEPRGRLREGLSALKNFGELSHSLRVGPKALAGVLPDVASGCAPLREALRALVEAVAPALESPQAARALSELVTPAIDRFERELTLAARHTLNARTRLALERQVSLLASDLAGARDLLELLIEALSEQPLRASVSEVVRRSLTSAQGATPASLALPTQDFEADLRPRLLAALLGVALALVAQRAAGALHVRLEAEANGFRLLVTADPPERADPGGRALDAAPAYLRAALELTGGRLEWPAESASLGLVFRAGHAMGKHV